MLTTAGLIVARTASARLGQRGRRRRDVPRVHRGEPSGSRTAWTPWATPPRRSPRATPSAPPPSPRWPCSPRTSRHLRAATRAPHRATPCSICRSTAINVSHPTTSSAPLIGGTLAFLFSGPGHPRGRAGRPSRYQGGAPPVQGAARHHGRHGATRVREGHRHLRQGQSSPGWPRAPSWPASLPVFVGFGDQLLRPRGVPGGRHRHRPAAGELPVQLRRRVGQRQEVHRGRPGGKGPDAHKAAVVGEPSATRSRTRPVRPSTL